MADDEGVAFFRGIDAVRDRTMFLLDIIGFNQN